jgi:hypothetical protein
MPLTELGRAEIRLISNAQRRYARDLIRNMR